MTGKRKRYGADFKAKVALEALKGELTPAEVAQIRDKADAARAQAAVQAAARRQQVRAWAATQQEVGRELAAGGGAGPDGGPAAAARAGPRGRGSP